MTNRLLSVWREIPTAAKVILAVIVVAALIGAWGNSEHGRSVKARQANEPSNTKTDAPPPSVGQRVFASRLIGYTTSEGRVLVAFEANRITRDSIEGDMKTFMRELMHSGVVWETATMSAYGFVTDEYGKRERKVVYTITIYREEASRVSSWDLANLVKVGIREYSIPQLID